MLGGVSQGLCELQRLGDEMCGLVRATAPSKSDRGWSESEGRAGTSEGGAVVTGRAWRGTLGESSSSSHDGLAFDCSAQADDGIQTADVPRQAS